MLIGVVVGFVGWRASVFVATGARLVMSTVMGLNVLLGSDRFEERPVALNTLFVGYL